tara:strand:+ start:129 stop:407 length:279 start_codon:yes stop_codon:yes gene_type:complete
MERGRKKMIIDFVDNTFTEQDFIFASSQFLSYDLPDDWNDMKVNDFCDWLEEHAWFPYENTKGQQILLNIEDYARNLRLYVNNALAEQESIY